MVKLLLLVHWSRTWNQIYFKCEACFHSSASVCMPRRKTFSYWIKYALRIISRKLCPSLEEKMAKASLFSGAWQFQGGPLKAGIWSSLLNPQYQAQKMALTNICWIYNILNPERERNGSSMDDGWIIIIRAQKMGTDVQKRWERPWNKGEARSLVSWSCDHSIRAERFDRTSIGKDIKWGLLKIVPLRPTPTPL